MSNENNNHHPKVGDRSEEGWIYVEPLLWIAPEDEGVMSYSDAQALVKERQEKGNITARLMEREDLEKIFNILVKEGKDKVNFNTKTGPCSDYWGAGHDDVYADFKRFSGDGTSNNKFCSQDGRCSVRLGNSSGSTQPTTMKLS